MSQSIKEFDFTDAVVGHLLDAKLDTVDKIVAFADKNEGSIESLHGIGAVTEKTIFEAIGYEYVAPEDEDEESETEEATAPEEEDDDAEESSDTDFNDLKELLDGYSAATPSCMRDVLKKARRIEEYSSTVQIAMLLLGASHFNMGEEE